MLIPLPRKLRRGRAPIVLNELKQLYVLLIAGGRGKLGKGLDRSLNPAIASSPLQFVCVAMAAAGVGGRPRR